MNKIIELGIKLIVFNIFLATILLQNSCSNTRQETFSRNETLKIPRTILIDFIVTDYTIVQHRIIDNPDIYLEYTGRYSDGNNIYFRLDSYPKTDYFWIVKMPNAKDISFTGEAKLIDYNVSLYELPPPPTEINIDITIENGYVINHSIDSFNTGTYGLFLTEFEDSNVGIICTLKSKIYKDQIWKFLLPKQDGYFRLIAKRI